MHVETKTYQINLSTGWVSMVLVTKLKGYFYVVKKRSSLALKIYVDFEDHSPIPKGRICLAYIDEDMAIPLNPRTLDKREDQEYVEECNLIDADSTSWYICNHFSNRISIMYFDSVYANFQENLKTEVISLNEINYDDPVITQTD